MEAPLDLLELLRHVPDILKHVPHDSLRIFVKTSRALRSQVHSYATSIKFYPEAGIQVLVKGQWPSLKTLYIDGPISVPNMRLLCHHSWQTLISLNLANARLDLACLEVLAQGSFSSLESLGLRYNNLRGDRMAVLQQGDWPKVKSLDLFNCNMDSLSIAHLTTAPLVYLEVLDVGANCLTAADGKSLSKGQWPQLYKLGMSHMSHPVVLDLDMNLKPAEVHDSGEHVEDPDAEFVTHLSLAHWPLQELDLGLNCLSTSNLKFLIQCNWPMLHVLILGDLELSAEGCTLLAQANWPWLETLELYRTGIDSTGMSAIVSATWPMLKVLNLSESVLDSDACAKLAKGLWPQLEKLCLRACEVSAAGVRELAKGKWPLLKVLDLACWGFDAHALLHVLGSNWLNLECLELPQCRCSQMTIDMRDLLTPNNKACLDIIDNVVEDARLIADGKWPRLQMLCFSYPTESATWIQNWGKVDLSRFGDDWYD